jgi:peroxiredoxin
MRRVLFAVSCTAALTTARGIAVGDTLPNVALDLGFPPDKVMMGDFCKGKKLVLVGLPGAFTPT